MDSAQASNETNGITCDLPNGELACLEGNGISFLAKFVCVCVYSLVSLWHVCLYASLCMTFLFVCLCMACLFVCLCIEYMLVRLCMTCIIYTRSFLH